ncbi:MAG: hypothetical protein JSV16_10470 [Candidatus Hydrogenedentota bacterium]|nr:MAG: hypothetical protein JSV16_10470 [Candidatus Hydrogenedentota bacterium]
MFQGHDTPLALAYLVGLGGWLLASRLLPRVWPSERIETIARPWKEFGIALLGACGILIMGQLWTRGIRLPEQGPTGPLLGSINQFLIFAPILLVMAVRRQPWTSAWLPGARVSTRVLVGLVLAGLAVTAYSLMRDSADAPWVLFGRIWAYGHIDEMVQVFLEDLTIAILFVRLAGAIGKLWATVVVAFLFAAGHIPAMVSQGVTLSELTGLIRDAGLGVMVILVLQRSRDVVWFWCIHFCLDMTQFDRISGIG